MRIISSLSSFLGITAVITWLHFITSYILPYPWNALNVLFVVLVLLISIKEMKTTVWLAFLSHFFLELYATTPFGVLLFSSTFSALLTFWLSRSLIVNKSWYSTFVLSAAAIVLYRILYSGALYSVSVVSGIPVIPIFFMLPYFGFELFLTSFATGILYLLLARSKKKPGLFKLYATS